MTSPQYKETKNENTPERPRTNNTINNDIDDVAYADASHWMNSVSSDNTGSNDHDKKTLNFTDIDLTALEKEKGIPDKGTANSFGRKVNIILCAIAFVVLFGYLFIADEGEDMLHALTSFNYSFLLILLVCMIVYWLLESVCMQIICNKLFRGFSFFKTFLVTIIGQYFNCITPLSSGGQPIQAYYYQRFGLPLEHSMPMLLCRFIVYQFTMTVYAIIVLILRFNYFMEDLRSIMYLVFIGFAGGFLLITMLLSLAFAKKPIMKAAAWFIRILGKIGILKQPEETHKKAMDSLEKSYKGIRFLLKEPWMLVKVCLITFVQLTVFFSMSFIIFMGFGLESNDYITVISCQAFIYLIASFVPLPGAIGASEASYITFFNYVYNDPSIVALSTFIWRAFTFYLPIVAGMIVTLLINKKNSFLSRMIRKDDARMAFTDHTVPAKKEKNKKED